MATRVIKSRRTRIQPSAEEILHATALDARSQKAWRAVRVFTQMLPQLTSFARMATGNQRVAVRLGDKNDRAATDGTIIYLQPPIDLGTERTHVRHLCDRRGPNKRQQCKACDAREVVLFYLFHEIAHIAFDSMVHPLGYQVSKIEKMIDEWHPEGCPHRRHLMAQMEYANDYLQLCSTHNGFLPILFNCLEDARVNARMFQARPGLRVMFDAGTRRVFDQGVTQNDGTVWLWPQQPRNSQAMVGLFLMSSGTEIESDFFAEEVIETLQDPALVKACSRVILARSPHQIMDVTLELFRRLNELGYLLVPKCDVAPSLPQPSPAGQGDEEQDANQQSSGKPEDSGSDGSSQTKGSEDSVPAGDAPEDEGDSSDDDRGAGEPGTEASGPSEDQQDSGGSQNAGEPDAPDDEDGDGDLDSDGSRDGNESGSGNRAGGQDQNADDLEEEDSSSVDDALRGSDNSHQEPESENESSASTQGSGGGSDRDDDDGDDSSDSTRPSGGDTSPGDDDPDSAPGEGGQDSSSSPATEVDGREDDEDTDESSDAADREGSEGSDDDFGDGASDGDSTEGKQQAGDESVWEDPDGFDDGSADDADDHFGDPAQVADLVNIFGGHRSVKDDDVDDSGVDHEHFGDEDHDHEHEDDDDRSTRQLLDREAVVAAARQAAVFDTQSRFLQGMDLWTYPQPQLRWAQRAEYPPAEELESPERVMGRAVMKARLVFEDNRRSAEVRHLKSGSVDARVLGKRAPFGDERLFSRTRRPGKKDYFFVIGVDCSGSTGYGMRSPRIKRAVMAQAALFTRLGIKFAIYGMTGGDYGSPSYTWGVPDSLWMLEIKSPDQPWDKSAKTRLANIPPIYENYDGHNLEFLRKVLDARTETKRGIIYYTDGEMPAANGPEELVILQTELTNCRRKGYITLGVGINTDSPRQYGLDTVQVDSDDDIHLVIDQLGRKLTER